MTDALLDESQRCVAEIAYGTRQVVTAGPGAGKTETVAALLEHLVEQEGLAMESEILAISFSNAAVNAVDRRLRAKSLPPAIVQTLDSLAADIIRDLGEGDLASMSFDDRILEARKLLDAQHWPRLENVMHLVIDEVQDIVGVRADLLRAILERIDESAGFTLLGDLAQGIYDFQIREGDGSSVPISRTTAVELMHSACADHGAQQRVLSGQYRARTRETSAAAALREAALSTNRRTEIDEFRSSLVVAGDIAKTAESAARWKGSTAFLTTTNGQALLVAQQLNSAGHSVELRRDPREQPYAEWIARALGQSPRRGLERAEFDAAVSRAGASLPTADLWRALRTVAGSRGSELDLTHLAARLALRRSLVPALTDHAGDQFVVSTIHRAKGLEFDNVVLVDFPARDLEADEAAIAEAARVQFVALTRASGRIVRASGPSDSGLTANTFGHNSTRWVRKGFKGGVTNAEIMPADVVPSELRGDDALRAQEALRSARGGMQRFEIVMDPRRSTLNHPVYTIQLGGVVVAVTSDSFGSAIARHRFGTPERGRPVWPTLGPAVSDTLITVPGASDSAAARWGLWLAPRLAGLIHIDWQAAS
ncbi:UvrD-helicase domain-containing protein [Salinibacterium sp. ZJ77]|uniref:UvrD-helicase domain-containing protein n=1 Tax=Salinibacterium sp. ZJ77 TaxID=2708337 RepID=UPI001423F551|nr:UvrD-helicase domain-containing protein [Salinibacterium sp. ZJ77]